MTKAILITVLSAMLLGLLAGAGKGALYFADHRYITQTSWVQEKRQDERRALQRRIDELEYIRDHEGGLTPRQEWQLRQLKSELRNLR